MNDSILTVQVRCFAAGAPVKRLILWWSGCWQCCHETNRCQCFRTVVKRVRRVYWSRFPPYAMQIALSLLPNTCTSTFWCYSDDSLLGNNLKRECCSLFAFKTSNSLCFEIASRIIFLLFIFFIMFKKCTPYHFIPKRMKVVNGEVIVIIGNIYWIRK